MPLTMVLIFVMTDCPISNAFAPEIQRLCASYRERGVTCELIYEDLAPTPALIARHRAEYGYQGIAARFDADRSIARRVQASVTPQAVVIDSQGAVRYRGRINNLYASLGRTRPRITQHDLRDALDAVVAGRPVAAPETQALGCGIADPSLLKD